MLRPTLVVLTDGRPNQDGRWATALAALRDPAFRAHPNIVAVGLGDVDTNILTQLATKPQYALVVAMVPTSEPAIAGFFTALAEAQSRPLSTSQAATTHSCSPRRPTS